MSLNWEFLDKERFKTIKDDCMNDAYVWGCLFVGLREITEKNAVLWHQRYTLYDKVAGPFYYKPGKKREPYSPTLDDVKKRVGLRTNVTDESTSAFMRKIWRFHVEQQKRSR